MVGASGAPQSRCCWENWSRSPLAAIDNCAWLSPCPLRGSLPVRDDGPGSFDVLGFPSAVQRPQPHALLRSGRRHQKSLGPRLPHRSIHNFCWRCKQWAGRVGGMRNDAERREGVGCRVKVACQLGWCWRSPCDMAPTRKIEMRQLRPGGSWFCCVALRSPQRPSRSACLSTNRQDLADHSRDFQVCLAREPRCPHLQN